MGRTELRTEIEINAPVTHVYGILTDFRRYAEWNPFITSVTGSLEVGQELALDVSLPEGSDYRVRAKVVRATPNLDLRWRGHLLWPGLLAAEHFFQVSAPREGVTRFVHGEDFSGSLLGFMARTLTLTARGSVYMNEALKKRAEGRG